MDKKKVSTLKLNFYEPIEILKVKTKTVFARIRNMFAKILLFIAIIFLLLAALDPKNLFGL